MPARVIKPVLFLALILGAIQSSLADWISREQAIMGTLVRAEVWTDTRKQGEQAIDLVMQEMRRIDALMSPFKPGSELSRINRDAAAGPVRVNPELFGLIRRSIDFSRQTDGAFDITFASAGYLYDYRKKQQPDRQQLQQALPAINYRHLRLDEAGQTVSFARKGVRIDLGGIAKGYAVERAIGLLRQQGIHNALVSAGGDSRILGDRRGRPWKVGIRDPRHKGRVVALLPLTDTAISTSGDYERFFMADGKRIHHILSPGTGRPATGVQSVTVIGPDATQTDALSTGVFVLGRERGLALVERLPGIDAVVVDSSGKMHFSSGLGQSR